MAVSLRSGQPAISLGERAAQAYEELTTLISEKLQCTLELARFMPKEHLAVKFIRACADDDTVISLNWDSIVDRAFLGFPTPIVANGESSNWRNQAVLYRVLKNHGWEATWSGREYLRLQRGLLIKLHGSSNWQICTNPKCPRSESVVALVPGEMPEKDDTCSICLDRSTWFMQEPTVWKDYSRRELTSRQYNLAAQAFIDAGRIVLFGVSVSDRDYRLNQLLRLAKTTAKRRELLVDVINPNSDPICQKIQSLFDIVPSRFSSDQEWLMTESERWQGCPPWQRASENRVMSIDPA